MSADRQPTPATTTTAPIVIKFPFAGPEPLGACSGIPANSAFAQACEGASAVPRLPRVRGKALEGFGVTVESLVRTLAVPGVNARFESADHLDAFLSYLNERTSAIARENFPPGLHRSEPPVRPHDPQACRVCRVVAAANSPGSSPLIDVRTVDSFAALILRKTVKNCRPDPVICPHSPVADLPLVGVCCDGAFVPFSSPAGPVSTWLSMALQGFAFVSALRRLALFGLVVLERFDWWGSPRSFVIPTADGRRWVSIFEAAERNGRIAAAGPTNGKAVRP
jgi:hypothetical protein